LLLSKFFPIVDTCLSCEDIAGKLVRWCPDGDFLGPAFPASRVQHVSDLHYKFTLEMWANAQPDGRPVECR